MRVDLDGVPPHVIRAKLRVPPRSPHHVHRPRLISFLDELAAGPVTIVSAPAGTGKTSLLAGWVAERDAPSAWLSLDDADHDAVTFWTSVVAALDTLSPRCGARATKSLRDRRPVIHAVGELLDGLDDRSTATSPPPRGSVLVIDDLQHLEETDDVRDSLSLFVGHLPDWLHLVLASRRRPDIHVDRLQAHGVLGEVGFSELRFSADEAEDLLSRLAPSFDAESIRAVAAKVDGLAAGLQIAALRVRAVSHQEPAELWIDADSMMRDFLFRDALYGEDPELVDVLLKVSLVERVNRKLAVLLTRRNDADELLERARQRGLFVHETNPSGWFEIHPLARSVLIAELRSRSPEQVIELHLRAARWFENIEDIPRALEHYLLAERPRDALGLLAARQAELYDAGQMDVIARTIDEISLQVAATDLDAMIDYARCNVFIDPGRFVDAVEQATWHAQQASALSAPTRGRLALVRSQSAFITGDFDEGGRLARESLAAFADDWWRDACGRLGWNMVASEIAYSERWSENEAEVREARLSLTRTPDRRLAYEGTRAVGEALSGRPLDALRIVAGTRRTADVSNMTVLRTELAMAEAIARRELGDAERALADLEVIVATPPGYMLFATIFALCELVHLHLDAGDSEAAADAHERAEGIVEDQSLGASARDWVARAGVHRALSLGRIEEAHRGAETITDAFWRPVSRCRVYLAERLTQEAADALNAASPRCVRHDVVLELLRARTADDHDEALKSVARAIKLAAPNGMLRTVATEGSEILELVEHSACDAPAAWLDRLRRVSLARNPSIEISAELVEPLTDRELEVLRFLPTRLTIREIAVELYVSVNTLKFHLRMIYRKLGVRSRGEAAAYARRLYNVPNYNGSPSR